MKERFVAIGLKIPDNAAYTAMVTLQRLGVDVDRVERSEIWQLEDSLEDSTIARRVERNETIFNPNKHRLTLLDRTRPRAGEVWIAGLADDADEVREHLGGRGIDGVRRSRRYVGWRLYGKGAPVPRDVVGEAVQRLLCNPAIERAIY